MLTSLLVLSTPIVAIIALRLLRPRQYKRYSFFIRIIAFVLIRRWLRGPLLPGWTWKLETFIAIVKNSPAPSALSSDVIARLRNGVDKTYCKVPSEIKRVPSIINDIPVEFYLLEEDYEGDSASKQINVSTLREIIDRRGGLIVYIHGGAYVLGSIQSHAHLVARLACNSKIPAISIAYSLAPENPFPASLNSCYSILSWLNETVGVLPEQQVWCGDSAGGGLTLALIIGILTPQMTVPGMSIPLSVRVPKAVVLISPWLDLSCSMASWTRNAEYDYLGSADTALLMAEAYAGDFPLDHPLLSPLFCHSFSLFPSILCICGEKESLVDEIVEFSERVKRNNVAIETHVVKNMCHGFPLFPISIVGKEVSEATDTMGLFINNSLRDRSKHILSELAATTRRHRSTMVLDTRANL